MSPIKNYFVRNIVLPTGRQHIYKSDMTKYEKDAMTHNKKLRDEIPQIYF